MRTFDELATEYQFAPTRGLNGDLAGYLHLDGSNTKAALNSKEFHHFDDDENGWFALELEDHRGSRVLLHNALTQSQSMPGSLRGQTAGSYTSEIFPNVVILGSENLRDDRTLHQLAFRFEGAENFFVYKTIEWRSFYRQPKKQAVLRTIRKEAWQPPKGLRGRDHFDDPDEIYVIHRPKRYLYFVLEDMKVEVWHSRSTRGLGWTGHEIRITPIVSVVFERPVSVDEAINRVWRIKGFFDQLALCDLRIQAISLSKFKKGWPAADVYLPNEARKTTKRDLDAHPVHVPFSRWPERRKLQASLQKWLGLTEQRRFFRSAVRLSLVRLQSEIDPTLITLLMAGVESLPELSGRSGISRETIDKMAEAAHHVGPDTDYESVRGLLGTLGRVSPKQRLQEIALRSFVSNVEGDIERFTSAAVTLRNRIAHGRGLDEFEQAAAGDLAQALTYLCVAYDLQTTGLPSAKDDSEKRELLALSRMVWAWMGYKRTVAQSAKRR